jgi:hypothetical protein
MNTRPRFSYFKDMNKSRLLGITCIVNRCLAARGTPVRTVEYPYYARPEGPRK